MYAIRELAPCDSGDIQNQVMGILRTSKEDLDDCLKLMVEAIDDQSCKYNHKRKHVSMPNSPSGVIDACFSSESSNGSWSVSSSPEPLFKRRRAQDPLD